MIVNKKSAKNQKKKQKQRFLHFANTLIRIKTKWKEWTHIFCILCTEIEFLVKLTQSKVEKEKKSNRMHNSEKNLKK